MSTAEAARLQPGDRVVFHAYRVLQPDFCEFVVTEIVHSTVDQPGVGVTIVAYSEWLGSRTFVPDEISKVAEPSEA